jgi:type I restriction enzyme M protein
MRMLVHYHVYGDAAKVAGLVSEHAGRIRGQIDAREAEETGRIESEYQPQADRLAALDAELGEARNREAAGAVAKLEKAREKLAARLVERDELIAETRRRAEEDRKDVASVGDELVAVYADPDELLKHARVVGLNEVEDNEFNLNIPRYVDTFEPEPQVEVKDALKALDDAEAATRAAETELRALLKQAGYGH